MLHLVYEWDGLVEALARHIVVGGLVRVLCRQLHNLVHLQENNDNVINSIIHSITYSFRVLSELCFYLAER